LPYHSGMKLLQLYVVYYSCCLDHKLDSKKNYLKKLFEKFIWKIHLKNSFEKFIWKIHLKNEKITLMYRAKVIFLSIKNSFYIVHLIRTQSFITGVAKVRPSKYFLRPLRQILGTQLSYLCKKNTQNSHQLCHTLRKSWQKFFLQTSKQYLNEIWPVSRKVWPPLFF